MAVERAEQGLGNLEANTLAHAASAQGLEGTSVTRHAGAVLVLDPSLEQHHVRPAALATHSSWHETNEARTSQRVVGLASSSSSSAQPLTWAKPPTAHTPNLREVCGSRLSAHAGWLANMRRLDSVRGRSFRVVANLWRSRARRTSINRAHLCLAYRRRPRSAIREENDESRHLGCAPRPRRRRLPRQPRRHGSLEDACRPDPRRERDRLRAAAGDDHGRLVHRDRCRTDHALWLCARRRLGRRHRSELAYGRRRPVRGRRSDLAYDPDPDSDRADAPHPSLRGDGGDPGPLLAACPALVRVRRRRHIAAACERFRHGAKTLMTLLGWWS